MKKELNMQMFVNEKGMEPAWLKRLSFTTILIVSNLLQTLFSKGLGKLTSKQWMLLTIASSLPEKPTLSELGRYMGCSRQNVKQIAEILHKNGYLEYTKNEGDRNTVRIATTEKWHECSNKYEPCSNAMFDEIFKGLSEVELNCFFGYLSSIIDNIEVYNMKMAD